MIYYAEINKSLNDHLPFNNGMLEIVKKNPFGSKLTFFCESDYFKKIRIENKEDIIHERIKVINGNYSIWVLKLFFDIINLINIFKKAKKNNVRLVFFSSMFPLSYYFFGLIRNFYKNIDVVIVLHGELQYIKSRSFGKNFILGFGLRAYLNSISDNNTRFLVLSDIIKFNLAKYIRNIDLQLLCIDHPYNFTTDSLKDFEIKSTKVLTFGTVGYSSKSKRSDFIFSLAKKLSQEIKAGKVAFNVVGKIESDIFPCINDFVNIISKDEPLSDYHFKKEVLKLDYILFFYDNDIYELSPSGVLFDAIECQKPILAFRNDILSFYFNKLGDIGYLCDDIDAMTSIIDRLINNFDLGEYEIKVDNLKKTKEMLNIRNLSVEFWQQYNFLMKSNGF